MQFLLDEIRMASNGKGESKMPWYAEVILSYIMVTKKQSDMERRHGNPHVVTSHSFFLKTLKSSLYHWVPLRVFGKKWWFWLEKKKKDLSRKMLVDGMLQAKVHQLHHVYWSIRAGAKKTYLRNQWITAWVWSWSKKGRFSSFPLLCCSERLGP